MLFVSDRLVAGLDHEDADDQVGAGEDAAALHFPGDGGIADQAGVAHVDRAGGLNDGRLRAPAAAELLPQLGIAGRDRRIGANRHRGAEVADADGVMVAGDLALLQDQTAMIGRTSSMVEIAMPCGIGMMLTSPWKAMPSAGL